MINRHHHPQDFHNKSLKNTIFQKKCKNSNKNYKNNKLQHKNYIKNHDVDRLKFKTKLNPSASINLCNEMITTCPFMLIAIHKKVRLVCDVFFVLFFLLS